MNKQFRHRLEYVLFRTVESAVRMMPVLLLSPLAHVLAFLVFSLFRYRRTVALANLAIAFPEKSPTERLRIARASYHHFMLLLIEFLKMAHWDVARVEKMITMRTEEIFRSFMERTGGRRTILVSGHLGSWEPGAALMSGRYLEKMSIIQFKQKNSLIDQYISDLRRRWGMRILYKRGAIQNGLTALQSGEVVGLLCDQDGGKRGVCVPFFGKMAATPVGAALLHLRSGAELLFAACIRTGRMTYDGYFIPLELPDHREVDDDNIRRVTAAFTRQLEEMVRRHPEQYLWMHRRWKTDCPEDHEKG